MWPAWRPWVLVGAVGTVLDLCRRRLPGRFSSSSASATASSCATRSAIPGTAARWNGRRRRRRRPSTFAVLPNVEGEEAYWEIKQRAMRQPRLATEPDYEADRDAAQQPDRIRHRVLRHRHRLRADLAYLVAGGVGARRRLRDLRRVRLARRRRGRSFRPTEVARIDRGRAARRGAALAASGDARPMSAQRSLRRCRPIRITSRTAGRAGDGAAMAVRPRSASSSATASGFSCSATS